jgi:hypothetical protein
MYKVLVNRYIAEDNTAKAIIAIVFQVIDILDQR